MWNIFLHYTYCAIEFVYVVVPSGIVETSFETFLKVFYLLLLLKMFKVMHELAFSVRPSQKKKKKKNALQPYCQPYSVLSTLEQAWTDYAADFSAAHILPCKKEATDLKVLRQISKTIRKLQWIPNTIINTNVLESFYNVYIYDGVKTALSTHGLRNI